MSIQLPGKICAPKKIEKFVVHCWKSALNTTEDQKPPTFFACGGQFSTILYSYLGKFGAPRKIEKLCSIAIAEKVPQIRPKPEAGTVYCSQNILKLYLLDCWKCAPNSKYH